MPIKSCYTENSRKKKRQRKRPARPPRESGTCAKGVWDVQNEKGRGDRGMGLQHMKKMLRRLQGARFFTLFNFHDELAKGRSCVLLHNALQGAISWLSTGLFYTSFLMTNGINIVNIGILTFVPYIANCFSIFSPSILERFVKRRWVLAGGRVAYDTIILLGITLMPVFVKDPTAKMVLFVGLTFLANIINALFSSGYSVWHVNFIPEPVRAEFFSINTTVTSFIGCGAALLSSVVADALAGSPYEDTIIVVFRYIAFALAMLDVVLLTLPKEYPYKKSKELPRLRHIVTKPFRHKKFVLTMAMVFAWTFFINVPLSSLNYYLINDVGVTYSFIYIINMFYPFFLLFFMPIWRKFLNRRGWFITFAVGGMLHCPTNLLYSCVTAANYGWLIPVVRLTQHFLGVGTNVAYANMLYINLPDSDQTNYVAFHTLVVNIAAFLGMMVGTGFVAANPDILVRVGSLGFTNVQMLLWVEALGELLVPMMILLLLKKLTPEKALA